MAEHPHRDGPTRLLMVALYQSGRQADALAAFGRHRDRLATDLGLEPSAELRQLEEQILTDDRSLALTASRALRGYQIQERLGEGAFSIVYRGRQPSVGREVAIKQIRAELANRPEFIRRFETEAHLVARLEHPHIVPLYDFWREPNSAYLVMRLLRGGSLESALRSGSLAVDRVVRLVGEIGGALSVAHRSGVVHRDVKPANILLDEDGHAYLTDFGIALDAAEAADPDAALSAGSPAYASPEQLRREQVGPPADVHGLAIAMYEALTGQLPFPDEPTHAALLQRQLHDPIPPVCDVRRDVPAAIDGVLARATAKDPTERFQSIEGFLEAVESAVDASGGTVAGVGPAARRGVGTAVSDDARNPYKGLRAFDEADAGDFAGRARLVDQLLETMADHRLMAVVGPSGSGKSSVVRAGLLPALRRGRVEGADEWFVTTVLPGAKPFEELETALLRVAAERPSDLLGVLESGTRGIARGVRHVVPEEGSQLLLVIDQFEELFTLGVAAETARFLDALAVAVSEERSQLRVVLTLRADFYDRPLRHDAVGRLVRDATVAVLPLAPDELEHAIVDPAYAVGMEFEPGLVSEIVADVADQPGALPLLQYALTELYERQVSGMLTRAAYQELGGVAGALASRAEELFVAASVEEEAAVRRVLGRLVSLGEGTEDTRRRALRSELGDDEAAASVIDAYGAARLLSFDRDPVTREPTVEVAHEALLREWPRLRAWLNDDRDGLRILRHLHTTAREWDSAGRPEAELYRGGRLEAAEEWATGHDDHLQPLERAFVEASVGRQKADEAVERERFDQQVRNNRRLRGLLTGVGILLVVALIAGGLAFQQRSRANENASEAAALAQIATDNQELAELRESQAVDARSTAEQEAFKAETRRLVADAAALAGDNPDVALLLAREAYARDPGPATESGLQRVLTRTGPWLGTIGAGAEFLAVEWLDDGTIVGLTRTEVHYYSDETHELLQAVALPASPAPAVWPDHLLAATGSTVAVGLDDGTVAIVVDGQLVAVPVSAERIVSVALSDDATSLAAGDIAGNVTLLSLPSGREAWSVPVIEHSSVAEVLEGEARTAWLDFLLPFDQAVFASGPTALRFDGDETLLVGAGVQLRRLDLTDGAVVDEVIVSIELAPGRPLVPRLPGTIDLREDGSMTAIAGTTGFVEFDAQLNIRSAQPVPTGRTDTNVRALGAAVSRSGETWFALSNGQLVQLATGDAPQGPPLVTGSSRGSGLARSPSGSELVIAGPNGLVRWSVDGRQLLGWAFDRQGNDALDISSDGRLAVASNTLGGFEAVLATRIDGEPELVPIVDFPATDLIWVGDDPLGRWITSFRLGRTLLVDRRTLEPVAELEFDVDGVGGTYSLDGRHLVTHALAGEARGVRVIEVPSGRPVSPFLDLAPWEDDLDIGMSSSSFNPAGDRLIVTMDSGTGVIFDTTDWEVVHVIGPEDAGGAPTARFLPDGSALATRGRDGSIVLRDPQTYQPSQTLEGGTSSAERFGTGPLISSDGEYLLTVRDQTPRLWHIATEIDLGTFPHDPGLSMTGVDFGDQLQLITGVGDDAIVWNLDIDSWPDIACRAVGRNLTESEWEQFGPGDTDYRATCPQWESPG